MRDINKHQIFVVFTIILVLSMTIYSNGHFRDLFSYYEHAGDKAYDLNDDGWSVDLDASFEMVNKLAAQVGAPTYNKTPNFKKKLSYRTKNKNMDW